MNFIISMIFSLLLVFVFSDKLKRKPLPFYMGAVILVLIAVLPYYFDIELPVFMTKWISPLIAGGGLAGALFVLVMYAGTFPPGSSLAKTFMPLRAQLSIIGAIFALGHSFTYGKGPLCRLLLEKTKQPMISFWASLLSLIMVVIMLPLFITSFKNIRRRMDGRTWKKLQKMAYLFYGLIFAHIVILYAPKALKGTVGSLMTLFIYSFVFIGYLFCRIIREILKKDKNAMARWQLTFTVASFVMAVLLASFTYLSNTNREALPEVAGVSREEQAKDSLKDGQYYGEAEGMNGKIGVKVTIVSGAITDIAIEKFYDDEEYFDPETDGKGMIEQMLLNQSPDVDTISGATYSSEGIKDAVKNALENAD